MAIHILPPQLANQIAAGEVVERPSSVIKELVENSIDAGADHIDIDIEQGGCKLIRIRDNGRGIVKDDLALALARHATSKIHCLDDLEAIISLGFRGEALASISSVSRLTLTSKTEEQSEAWQVYAEGRDMLATIKPAAHPTGTTVEVLDLFYNTPARRRFLKTEKTEFTHIDEMIRRIALAYPKVAFNLQHNGKLIKQYRRAESDIQIEKRLATICGIGFIQQAIKLSWQHDDLSIHGWVAPNVTPDLQYFYVNGRVIKDKLLNHALKQAFIEFSQKQGKTAEQTLSYVIYLDLNPHQVDVNVHPAKHEVRFHEARLVHDFVYQAMIMALRSHENLFGHNKPEHAVLSPDTTSLSNRAAAGTNIYDIPSSYSSPVESSQQVERKIIESAKRLIVSAEKPNHIDINRQSKIYGTLVQAAPVHIVKEEPISSQQQSVIESLFPPRSEPLVVTAKNIEVSSAVRFGKVITIIANQYVILEKYENYQQQLGLLSIKQAQIALFSNKILTDGSINNTERLLIPLSLLLNKKEQRLMLQMKAILTRFHFEFDIVKEKLQLSSVPKLLRQANWQQLLPKLITFLFQEQENIALEKQLLNWLIEQHCCMNEPAILWSIPKAIQLLGELEQMDERDISVDLIIKPIDLSIAIAQFGGS